MTGLHDTDIRLNDEWALTQAADGDAPLCSGLECLYQVIVPESIEIDVGFSDDTFRLRCSFRFADEEEPRELNVVISAVGVEVITT